MTRRYRYEETLEAEHYEPGPKRLRRNKIDGVLGGVCAGLADYFGIDVVIMRIAAVVGFMFLGGITFPAYILMWIFVPKDKRAPYYREYREARKARRKQRSSRTHDQESARVRTASFRDVKSKFRSLEERLQDLERSVTSKEWRLRREFRDLEN